jgi:cobalt-zinc-cadmium efflux system outer membrane protein
MQLMQAQQQLTHQQIAVTAQVRAAHRQLQSYQQICLDYQQQLLPTYQTLAVAAEKLYNIMGLGVDKLLESKWQAIYAQQQYTDRALHYWLAKVALDRALGGYLSLALFPSNEQRGGMTCAGK